MFLFIGIGSYQPQDTEDSQQSSNDEAVSPVDPKSNPNKRKNAPSDSPAKEKILKTSVEALKATEAVIISSDRNVPSCHLLLFPMFIPRFFL